jgi:ribosomal protein L3
MDSMAYLLLTVSRSNIAQAAQWEHLRYHFNTWLLVADGGQDPGRVLPGKKMAGHMGAKNVTTPNIQVVQVDPSLGLLLVKGPVPGPSKGVVYIRDALKKSAPTSTS